MQQNQFGRRMGKHQYPQKVEIYLAELRSNNAQGLSFSQSLSSKNTYSVKASSNIVPIIMVLSSFLKSKCPKTKPGLFQLVNFINVPRYFQEFNNAQSLNSLESIFVNKCSNLADLQDLVSNYPVIEFFLNSYARKTLELFICGNDQELDLMGNELKIIENYEMELRGNLLHLLAKALGFEAEVHFYSIVEKYGNIKNSSKLTIQVNAETCQWTIPEASPRQKNAKLITIKSAKNISAMLSPKMANSSILADTTSEGQSIVRTANHSIQKNDSYYKVDEKLNKQKYISPRQINKNNRFGDSLSLGLIRPRKITYNKEDHHFCVNCNKLQCKCQI